MGISVSQVYRVREGTRGINQKFIIGAIRAFPERRLGDLFYLAPHPGGNGHRRGRSGDGDSSQATVEATARG